MRVHEAAAPMTLAEHLDLVSRLVNELLEMLPEEKHDHLEELAYAIDWMARSAYAHGVRFASADVAKAGDKESPCMATNTE